MRIYIVRHGDPDYENDTLTCLGQEEAKALAMSFEREGLDFIYSSPMGRARQTMQYTADALGMQAGVEEWTQELPEFKVEVGLQNIEAWNLHGEIIQDEMLGIQAEAWMELPWIKNNPNIAERYEIVKKGSDDFLSRHGYVRMGGKYRIVKPNRDKIAVFCHAGFAMAWLSHLLGIPLPLIWSGFWLPSSSVTTVLFEERTDKFAVPRCLSVERQIEIRSNSRILSGEIAA